MRRRARRSEERASNPSSASPIPNNLSGPLGALLLIPRPIATSGTSSTTPSSVVFTGAWPICAAHRSTKRGNNPADISQYAT